MLSEIGDEMFEMLSCFFVVVDKCDNDEWNV